MLHINASITKTDLIRELENESGKPQNLYLIVESLPSFLNTPIAFTVFNYQISKYPRPVFWWSQEKQILDFLQSCTTSVANPTLDKNFKVSDNSIIQYEPIESKIILSDARKENIKTEPVVEIKPETSQNVQSWTDTSSSKHVFSSQEMMNQNHYDPIEMIKDGYENSPLDIQNFDAWIKKIEATKEALSSLQTTKIDNSQTIKPSKQKNKVFRILSLSLALSLIFILGLLVFPAKVYTVEISPSYSQGSQSLSIPISEFSKSSIVLTADSETVPQGNLEVPTDRAIGQVQLINQGSRPVDLDNGMFRLVLDQKYYQVIADNTLPKTFSIPAQSDSSSPLVFQVQAVQDGSDYNQPKGTQMDIVNLQGDGKKVCSSCYAVATTDIKNSTISGQKVVTSDDQSLLTQNVEAKFATQRQDAISKIQQGKVYTNEDWYKNTSSQYNFNKNLNDATDLLRLDATTNTDVYYLTQDQLGSIIKQNNQDIKSFSDITIHSTDGNPRSDDKINMDVYYTYETQNTCLDKQKFVSTLSSTDFDEAKKQILVDCPGVTDIQQKSVGINMPGVPTRVDLNLTQS
jgi:hypothetical protein